MKGKIRFVRVRNGTEIELGSTGLMGVSGHHKFLGFKPGKPGKAEGWLVFLVFGSRDTPHRIRKD